MFFGQLWLLRAFYEKKQASQNRSSRVLNWRGLTDLIMNCCPQLQTSEMLCLRMFYHVHEYIRQKNRKSEIGERDRNSGEKKKSAVVSANSEKNSGDRFRFSGFILRYFFQVWKRESRKCTHMQINPRNIWAETIFAMAFVPSMRQKSSSIKTREKKWSHNHFLLSYKFHSRYNHSFYFDQCHNILSKSPPS